ncbi:MAG: hypothetical protein KF861_22515 [Planctomycetaceae bacterium]|nr:hypothetical protein [Planctomycetaceae bacterium]
MSKKSTGTGAGHRPVAAARTALVALLLVPLALVLVLAWGVRMLLLLALVWTFWCPRGIHVLLVTSDSPVWREHIERRLRPRLPDSTRVLNWSQRSMWRATSLRVMVFRAFGGQREFNPLVLVFRPFCWPRRFRLWAAFRDAKHGRTDALERVERDLFDYLRTSRILP